MNSLDRPQPTREDLIEIAVQQAAKATEGTFSQRNPMLGKMVRCPYCGRRRRQNADQACCNPKLLVGNKADMPRSFYKKMRKNPRLTRHRPPLFEIHQRLVELEATPGYVEREGISGIVEALVKRRIKSAAKGRRKQQKQSRKANRRSK